MSNFWKNKNISITGGHGFLGKYLKKKLEQTNCNKISLVEREKYNLVINKDVKRMYDDLKPDIVFHLAAVVGGIEINQKNPGKFFYENAMINLQVIHESYLHKIEKIISIGTVSIYPENAPLPFNEKNIWDGYPEEANAPYGIAKRIMHVQSSSYRKQYGYNSILLLLTNLFGPEDNFNPQSSHVVASLIKKFHDAKINNKKEAVVWGDGESTRDFCYVEDIAEGIVLAAEKYDDFLPINLGTEEEISIKQLAKLISELMKFDGEITWDTSKPNGQPRRCVSNKKAREKLNFKPEISLTEGLRRTIEWYTAQ